jgi:hypothetical protein
MEASFLYALVLIFGVSALTIFVLHRVKVPPLVGFIVAGVIIGPNGLGLIDRVFPSKPPQNAKDRAPGRRGAGIHHHRGHHGRELLPDR